MEGRPTELGERSQPLASTVRSLAQDAGITPMPKPPHVRPELVELGQALIFDKILSGNHDISCMTCHPPSFGTSDGRSLPIGAAGSGLGPARVGSVIVPRNVPTFFNVAQRESLFWDGRVSPAYDGVKTPAGSQMTPEMQDTLEFGVVSALAMFPPTSTIEMRGVPGTNEIASLAEDDFTGIWDAEMTRLGAIPEYVDMFEAAYPGQDFEDMTFAHGGNAIAGFLVATFPATNSRWDQFLKGKDNALTKKELEGALAFFDAGCPTCHTGAALSDFDFHNTGLAQFGPGQGDGPSGHDDFGRFRETGKESQRYAFRTPPLRNVEFTAPYGHAGEFPTLEDFVMHYVDPEVALVEYDDHNIIPSLRPTIVDNYDDIVETLDPDLPVLAAEDVPKVVAFLKTLSDNNSKPNKLSKVIPKSVPSGLPVAD
jgi:cytochrome c peroxidase